MNEKKIYRHYGSEHFDPEKFNPIHGNMNDAKPHGGFWASPLINGTTPWECFCKDTLLDENLDEYFDFTLSDNANVLHIWNVDDVTSLPHITDEGSTNSMLSHIRELENLMQERERDTLYSVFARYIDFERLVQNGVQAMEVHYGVGNDPNEYNDALYMALYTWDYSSILIMDPSIITEISTETINKIQDGEVSA